ncbi:MAG: hypothetical protein ACJATE_001844 [Bacteroidia bacterium]|jgi:hypothetical protein
MFYISCGVLLNLFLSNFFLEVLRLKNPALSVTGSDAFYHFVLQGGDHTNLCVKNICSFNKSCSII